MKKLSILLFALAVAGTSWAQASRSEFEVIREIFKTEKKAVVAGFLNLSDADANKFWPIYDKYEAERTKIGTDRFNLINNYVEKYATLTDAQADELMTKSLDIQKQEIALKKKYYGQVKKSLGATKAASFTQLEEFISVAVRASLYESLPMVGEK